jgi:anti-anti-sigma factor
MSPLARVIDEHIETVAVAAVDGEIDSSNVVEIGRRVRETLTNQSMALVVDLARTTYLDSAGINMLFALGAELRQRQQRLHLAVPEGSPIARMLGIAGVDISLPVHDTRDAAVAAASRDG